MIVAWFPPDTNFAERPQLGALVSICEGTMLASHFAPLGLDDLGKRPYRGKRSYRRKRPQ